MKGVVFLGDSRVELRDFPDPLPGPRDVVLEVKASGMCGTDLLNYRRPAHEGPHFIAGHEPCGIVVERGSAVTEKEAPLGARVMVHHYDGCGVCRHCQSGWTQLCADDPIWYGSGQGHGSHAKYIKVAAHTVLPLPDELSFEAGAAVSCGTGTAFGAIQRMKLTGSETFAVFGQGPVGLSATQLAVEMGVRVIAVDISDARLDVARQFGAYDVINPQTTDPVERIMEITHGQGVPKSLETSSAQSARTAAIRSTSIWGVCCLVGVGGELTLNVSNDLIRRQVSLIGHLTFSKMGQAECAAFVAERGIDVDGIFTHHWSLEQADEAYKLFSKRNDGKGVFHPG